MSGANKITTRLTDVAGNLALGRIIARGRLAAGLSQRQLAKRLQRVHSYVAKIEGGQRSIHVLELLAIARVVSDDPVAFVATLARTLLDAETASPQGDHP